MGICNQCGTKLDGRNHSNLCTPCATTCLCGSYKDKRSKSCRKCNSMGLSTRVKAQWQQVGEKMRSQIRLAGNSRRVRLADLGRLKWQTRADGRYWNWYWAENEDKKRTIYRYQWVWVMAHGPIPAGFCIHHINQDCSDDRLENLELIENHKHAKLHGKIAIEKSKRSSWECLTCGKVFRRYLRSGKPRKYCSKECYRRAQRCMISVF